MTNYSRRGDQTSNNIFDIIKKNKARNIYATIIDYPILQQNPNLQIDKLLDYSNDRKEDMSLMKYMLYGTGDKMICCEISLSGYVVAVGFEDGLIKIFKRKIGTKSKTYGASSVISQNDSAIDGRLDMENKESIDKLIGHKGAVY